MKILKDFIGRNNIDAKARYIVMEHFTKSAIRKIKESNEKKTTTKLNNIINKLRREAGEYSKENQLGIYGKARLIRSIQNNLRSLDCDESHISYVINKLVYL